MTDSSFEKQIRDALKQFWEEQSITVDDGSASVDDLVAAMDSMTAVDSLIQIERIVGMKLPVGEVIQPGGYKSEEEFIEGVTARVLKYAEE